MGRTKWYAESEDNTPQQGNRNNTSSQHRRRKSSTPGRFFEHPLDAVPLRLLLRQIYQRFRRTWIAFCFQANRYTLGIFHQQTALKLGTLLVVGYALLFSQRELWIFSSNPAGLESGAGPVETALEVSTDGNSHSISWKPRKKDKVQEKKNQAAPVSASSLGTGATAEYIRRYSKIAITEMKRYGIPASISLAQGLVESRSGSSKLATRNNNHFGMKCFSRNCGKGHCSNFADDHHKDFFRIFKNPWDSWRAHSQMLANGRYLRLKKYGRDYRKWAQGLEQLGYATDRSYSEKLIGVIEKYDLHRFDY
ncbi:MAG: glucosaminidase domain-containing protein [Saprospiraceae bacterium]|nr:glucosaminidase domain-containing protein [Saprospiraceae bacterium]